MSAVSSIAPRLASPGPDFRGTPFWAWNGRLDPEECRRQVRVFAAMGFGGFFMHSRTGLATRFLGREWFDCVRASMDEAQKHGIRAWMYDEDRYPSGSAGGQVTVKRRFRGRHVAFEEVTPDSIAAAERRPRTLAWFAETPLENPGPLPSEVRPPIVSYRRVAGPRAELREGERLVRYFVGLYEQASWFNGQTYPDTLNPAAIREFVRLAYEPYARELGADFGGKIPGCFTDEPCFSNFRPWTGAFRREFAKAHGYDIIDHLPEVWKTVGGEPWSRVRHDFVSTATTLFVRAYAKTIGNWCGKHGVLFTGHILEEDTVARQTTCVGSAMRFYEHMQAPGIDQLSEIWNTYAAAKQCSSAAHQFGREYRIAECYGVTGWDFPLEGHKAIGDWLFALGINHRCPHLAWYTMEGQAKRDYPASIFRHSPWFELYGAVEDYFARLGEAMADGDEVRPLLVLSSVESAWGLHVKGWTPEVTALDREQFADLGALLGGHIDFDYGDEGILAQRGRVLRGRRPRLRVGRARYEAVLVPALRTIRRTTLDLLSAYAAAGGPVFFVGNPPALMGGAPSAAPAKAYSAFRQIRREEFATTLAPLVRRVSVAENGAECKAVLTHLRAFDDGLGLFVCNTSCPMPDAASTILAPRIRDRRIEHPDAVVRVTAPRRTGTVFELDPATGDIRPVRHKYRDGAFEFAAPLARLQSRLFYICRSDIANAPVKASRSRKPIDLALPRGPMRYRLHEPNALVLDGASWSVDGGQERRLAHVLDIDEAVRRDFLGVAPRGRRMVQPWCSGEKASAKSVRVRLRFRFSWRGPDPSEAAVRLAVERPDLYAITLNGVAVPQPPTDGPWWVDPCLRLVDIPRGAIRRGENTLELDCPEYDERLPGFEPLFLLGDFGVDQDGATVIRPPKTLRLGDLRAQGLPNYSGNISFFVKPRVPKSGPCRLRIDAWHGTALGFRLNGGKEVFRPWPPYDAVFDEGLRRDGSDEIEIVVYGHRRNAFGPFYLPNGEASPTWCGPDEMRSTSAFPNRNLVPFGLDAP